MGENIVKNKVRPQTKHLILIKKGERLNPNGRPLGQRNYATIYREAMIKLADKNNTTPEALENEMIANGAVLARKGDFRFYKDTLDRLHGSAQATTIIQIDDKTKEKSNDLLGSYLAGTSNSKPTE